MGEVVGAVRWQMAGTGGSGMACVVEILPQRAGEANSETTLRTVVASVRHRMFGNGR